MSACCTGCSAGGFERCFCLAYQVGRPSSVVTDFPLTAETGVIHERISTPFSNTEQEPHWPRPQPNLGPWRYISFVRTYSSGVSGVEVTVQGRSFTVI